MSESSDLRELIAQLKELTDKLDAPKPKDVWDRLPVVTTFLSTVVVAALGLFLTHWFQRAEAQRQQQLQHAQMEAQRAQIRIEELKALVTLTPLLASEQPRSQEVARMVLSAISRTSRSDVRGGSVINQVVGGPTEPSPAGARPGPGRAPKPEPRGASTAGTATARTSLTSLIDEFARIALNPTETPARRIEATREIGVIAARPTATREVRARAAEAATQIAISPAVPEAVRLTAAEVVERIKTVRPDQVGRLVANDPIQRPVNEVILHHSGSRTSAYRGAATMFQIAKFQTERLGWSRVSWHFAVAPDGEIWLGMPLGQAASHAGARHNRTSVSLLLVMDGDRELPTEAQRRSTAIIAAALANRFGWAGPASLAEHIRLHREVSDRSCPGKNVTRELALSWMGAGAASAPSAR